MYVPNLLPKIHFILQNKATQLFINLFVKVH